ncbi:iron chaperone [Timonella senegalensis]|uniref:iron chaperone n=1 Tax=Timonella senegalensis TaxID=1465825 RepID=UPI0002F99B34|nr:DUF1801 domain-containing protein [Timonella senegalensis]
MAEFTDYIAGLGEPEKSAVERIHQRALSRLEGVGEGLGYGMPALTYRGKTLLSVQVAKSHIAYYPFSGAVVEALEGDLANFDHSKGTIRFSVDHPLPDDLVDRLIDLRRAEIDLKPGK